MIYSMTGFGQATNSKDGQEISIELKTVNNRFKDFRFRMPSSLSAFEIKMRDLIGQNFQRGTFEVSISVKKMADTTEAFNVDTAKFSQFLQNMQVISVKTGVPLHFSVNDIFRSEFAAETDEENQESYFELVEKTLFDAIKKLKSSRADEGKKLKTVLLRHLNEYSDLVEKVKKREVTYRQNVEDKLRKKIQDVIPQLKVEENRLLQEVVYYMEKLDVHEEFDRIAGHLSKFHSVLETPGETGRQLEFLLQELGRETNTIGSKASDKEISEHVVGMKTMLEKIREQAANIE